MTPPVSCPIDCSVLGTLNLKLIKLQRLSRNFSKNINTAEANRTWYKSACLYLHIKIYLCLYISISSICIFIYLCTFIHCCIYIAIYIPIYLFIFIYWYLYLYLSAYVFPSLCMSNSKYVYMYHLNDGLSSNSSGFFLTSLWFENILWDIIAYMLIKNLSIWLKIKAFYKNGCKMCLAHAFIINQIAINYNLEMCKFKTLFANYK